MESREPFGWTAARREKVRQGWRGLERAGLGEMIANSFYWTGPTDAQVLKAGVLVLVGIA